MVFQFFFQDKIASVEPPNNSLHVLDMYRTVILGTNNPSDTEEEITIRLGGEDVIRSAVELTEAGIKIKKSKSSSIKDISFNNGVLRLPRIVVDDTTESLFLNLIAYERFHVGAGNVKPTSACPVTAFTINYLVLFLLYLKRYLSLVHSLSLTIWDD